MGTIVSSGQLGALIYDIRTGERVHIPPKKDKGKIRGGVKLSKNTLQMSNTLTSAYMGTVFAGKFCPCKQKNFK